MQGRALTRSEMGFINQVNNLRGEFQNWEYGVPRLPTTDSIRLKDKELIVSKQLEWKKSIEGLKERIPQI